MHLPVVHPPAENSKEELEDLLEVLKQYQNKKVPAVLQKRCDEDVDGLFIEFLENRGHRVDRERIKETGQIVMPIIKELKEYYDRSRPAECAEALGIPFKGDYLASAQTPSYPSGHTIQAYFLAGKLSEAFPMYEAVLNTIAELISQSRIDRGIHFPTDVEYGKLIASELLNKL